MERILSQILCKPSDFILCNRCRAINWYENEKCRECNHTSFICNEENIIKWAEEEYKYYAEDGYTENEIDGILTDV